eukprot:TRINITY_DN6259_c0_g1_i1.p2 TRINITY_DN6259_c0_g1~~TRINITY_DN6259_c0_g1_i1.p2  ORF type:complete len:168 (-),score=43.97 TRINITY_DN6259_c0_g1_i1:144-647(-)
MMLSCLNLVFFFFSSRRRHTRCREVSWARRCVQETGTWESDQSINVKLCSIVSKENVCCSDFTHLLRDLKFFVVSTSIKQDKDKSKNLYEVAVNNLIKKFYSFLKTNQEKCGGIIVESKQDKMPQKFFDIYIDRGLKFYMYKDITKKINKFMIYETCNEKYLSLIHI